MTSVQLIPLLSHNSTVPRALAALGLIALIAFGWGGVVFGSFQYDDYPNLLNDPATAGGSELTARLAGGIRPLTRLTYAIDFALWGEWPGGWLLFNLLLHGSVALGLRWIARARGAEPRAAMLAAAVFALQPAHGATVAYVSGRSSGLAAALLIGALAIYESNRQAGTFARHALAMLLFVAACVAKETALVFPALLALWEWTRGEPPCTRRSAVRVAPFALLALLLAGYALTIPRYATLLNFSLQLRAPLAALAHNASALPVTLSLLVRPWELSALHAPLTGGYGSLLGGILLAAWVTFAVTLRGRQPEIALGMLWPVIALLPTHSFVAKLDAVSESPLYLAWVGPSFAIGVCAARWLKGATFPYGRRALVAGLLLLMAGLCLWRTAVWGDPIQLWQEAVMRTPQAGRAWNNLGMAYFAVARGREAKGAFEEALRLDPSNTHVLFNLDLLELTN